MRMIYTHRQFPALVDVTVLSDAVYEVPEISEIYRRRCQQDRPGFTEELYQIGVMLREWTRTGGFFRAALDPTVRVSGAVQSFIAETAMFLTKRCTRRRVSFQDRALMMRHDTPVPSRLPIFSAEEAAALNELADMTPEAVIQMWVTRLGVDDLSQTLQLYVGDRTTEAVL